jgi:hypothetical protein
VTAAAAGRGDTRLILPLTLLAAALALLVPSSTVAGRSDVLLALLVLATALGIPWSALTALRSRAATVAFLSVAPLVVLATFAGRSGTRSGRPRGRAWWQSGYPARRSRRSG